MYKNFAPHWGGRYLSSNVNITVADPHTGAPVSVPVGSRFTKFKTRKGRKVTSLGVLYDFTGNDKNTTVQKVADMVKEEWVSCLLFQPLSSLLLRLEYCVLTLCISSQRR